MYIIWGFGHRQRYNASVPLTSFMAQCLVRSCWHLCWCLVIWLLKFKCSLHTMVLKDRFCYIIRHILLFFQAIWNRMGNYPTEYTHLQKGPNNELQGNMLTIFNVRQDTFRERRQGQKRWSYLIQCFILTNVLSIHFCKALFISPSTSQRNYSFSI